MEDSETLKKLAAKVFFDTLSELQDKIRQAQQESGFKRLRPIQQYALELNLDSFANEYELIKAKKSTKPKAYRDLIVYLYAQAQDRYWKLFNKENETP